MQHAITPLRADLTRISKGIHYLAATSSQSNYLFGSREMTGYVEQAVLDRRFDVTITADDVEA